MASPRSAFPVVLILVIIALASVAINYSGVLKAQLLQAPESLSRLKLVKQETDPVQFDIYYDQLSTTSPEDIGIVVVNVLIQQGSSYRNITQMIDSVQVNSGQQTLVTGVSNQTLTIRNIQSRASSKLGTIKTFIKRDEYISLEYDAIVNRKRVTLFDHPVPSDFPLGYHRFQNPTNELLYIRTPEFHTILGDRERVFSKVEEISQGVLLLGNTMTAPQALEGLTSNTLISQSVQRDSPELLIQQQQIVMPPIEEGDLNTLIIRYRVGNNPYSISSFYLPSNHDITLPVPTKNLLDFYTEVDYSFAIIGSGFSTQNLSFPFNSLLQDGQFPVFYRTDFVSLIPELVNAQSSLPLNLQVNIAPEANAIAIGILSREPIFRLRDAISQLQQKLPIVLFEEDSETLETFVNRPDQLPYFNLIGQHDQIWNRRINTTNFDLVSTSFKRIPLITDDQQIPDLEVVNRIKGESLICLLKTNIGSYSLSILDADLVLSSSCLLSARRAGFTEGTIFPLVFDAERQELRALKHYKLDESLSDQVPSIKSYDPVRKNIALNNVFTNEKVRLLASPSPQFEIFSMQPAEIVNNNSLKVPVLPDCSVSCYFKVASIIRDDDAVLLGYVSDTMMIAATPLPVVELCFINQPLLEKLYDPSDLEFNIMTADDNPVEMVFQEDTGCYQHIVGGELEEIPPAPSSSVPSTFNAAPGEPDAPVTPPGTPPATPTSFIPGAFGQDLNLTLNGLLTSPQPQLPAKTIVFHSNGFSNNHINIPAQRHYLVLKNDSIQQVLVTELVFEHLHLESSDQPQIKSELRQSYQMTILGQDTHLFPRTRGNIILQAGGEEPAFLKTFDIGAPLNETLLFPGGRNVLSIPNTIRLLASEDVVIQGFEEDDKMLSLVLPVPERSQVRLFLENVFRPRVKIKQLISDGITFDPATNFMTLENPTGTMSIPLQVSVEKPTDTAVYSSTFPATPVPDDINLGFFTLRFALHVVPPPDIPNTSVLEPILLEQAAPGSPYETTVNFGGIEKSTSFEIGESRFFGDECAQVLKFNKKDRTITGQLSEDTQLTACYYEVSVKYLIKVPYAQIEITTLRTYRIPLVGSADAPVPEPVEVPINTNGDPVNQVIAFAVPLEELTETTSQFADKGSEAGLVSALGNLTVIFDAVSQTLVIGGTGELLQEQTSRFIRALRQDTGELVLLSLDFVPIKRQEIILQINQDFPNIIDVPVILRDQGFTDEDLATLRVITDSLSVSTEVSEDGQVGIFGLPELQDQIFSAVIQKQATTPSALLEFESRLSDTQTKEPGIIHVDFRLQLIQPETLTAETITLRAGREITIDLNRIISNTTDLVISQLPSFLHQQGAQLTGIAPPVAQDLSLMIQDYASVTNIIVPLKIVTDESPPVVTTPPTPDDTTHEAADDCFPDISGQPVEIQEAICLAKDHAIISGSGGLFKPNDPINRAEVSKILITGPLVIFGLLKESEIAQLNTSFPQSNFSDVPRSAWFYGFVETAREVGIIDGHPDGSFRPGVSVNNAEAAKMIVNTMRELQPASFTGEDDLNKNTLVGDPWYAPYVRILNRNGGDLPDPGEAAELSKPMSRAEFIYNLIILLDSKAGEILGRLSQ